MKLLTIIPQFEETTFQLYDVNAGDAPPELLHSQEVKARISASDIIASIKETPDVVAVYNLYGGTDFQDVVLWDALVQKQLESHIAAAPLHVPRTIGAITLAREAWPDADVLLVSGTSLFTALPDSEAYYAIDGKLSDQLGLRRFGYHGLFHRAAITAARQSNKHNTGAEPKVLSICIEPRLEAAALMGEQPLLVTGGATLLEGLPGHTTCGEIDPGMLLIIAREQNLGPEEINIALTRQSGLRGLVGERINFADIFVSESGNTELARQLILYRLLLTAGSSLAAMDAIDYIAFSGRYAEAGKVIGPWLIERLNNLPGAPNPQPLIINTSFDELLVREAVRGVNNLEVTNPVS